MPNNIRFYSENIPFVLKNKRIIKNWLFQVIESEGKKTGEINIIFCSDDYLLEINKQYLTHDFFTDIITFDYTTDDIINGELYISIDRVKENAEKYLEIFDKELKRVMVHGILHLLGYKDKTPKQEKEMRQKEESSINLM